MTTLQKVFIIATLVAGMATWLVIQHQTQVKLREENALLRQQIEQLSLLTAENERLSNLVAKANPALTKDQLNDLLRLRGEVGVLRRQTNELAKLQAEKQRLRSPPTTAGAMPKTGAAAQVSLPKESWAFAGYADPESAFQSALWAGSQGNAKTFLASLAPGSFESEDLQANKSEDEISKKIRAEFEKVTAFKIIGKEVISDFEVMLTVYADGVNEAGKFRLLLLGNEWKFAGSVKNEGTPGTK